MANSPTNPQYAIDEVHDKLRVILDRASKELPELEPEKVVELPVTQSVLEKLKSGPNKFSALTEAAIDAATKDVVADVEALRAELDEVIASILERDARAKAMIREHYQWATEAALFNETIRIRMLQPFKA